jgi:hypothetical protein
MMRKLGILTLSFLATTAVRPAVAAPTIAQQAESQAAKPAAPSADARVAPEAPKLSDEILAQHQKFQRLLSAPVKHEIDRLVPGFQKQVAHAKPGTDLRALAVETIRKMFPNASPKQFAPLVFELIAESLGASKGSMSDMSTQNQMDLQMSMEQKSQLEETLSNVLKTIQDTQDSIIQNIK